MQKLKLQNEGLNEHDTKQETEKNINKENGMEKEEKKEVVLKINTMKDFLDALYWSYEEADSEEKAKIGHQIVKIKSSLSSAGLTPERVYVEETPDGVLGLYNTQDKNISISEELLEDFNSSQSMITHVLFHEKMHAKGYADEGLTEIVVDKRIPAAIKFYPTERNKTERTFHALGLDKTIDLYDLGHPEKLIDGYLEVELKNNFPTDKKMLAKLRRDEGFKIELNNAQRHYEDKLSEVVGRLKNKLRAGYLRDKIKEIWQDLLKK